MAADSRADHRVGVLAALVAGVAGSKKPDGTPFRAEDFFGTTSGHTEAPTSKAEGARRARGVDTGDPYENNVIRAWDTWAAACQAVEKRKMQVAS